MSPEVTATLHDPARLAALCRLHLLDTPPEEAFDRVTRLASRTLRVPIALVNLIDADRQFFKSAVGMEIRALPLTMGVCSHALASREPLVIEDARQDPRFSSNAIVTEFGLVAYLGIPLITSEGHALGTFCVVDPESRVWEGEDLQAMRDLAGSVATELELRLAVDALERKAEEAEVAHAVAAESEARYRSLAEDALGTSEVGTFILDADFQVAWANEAVGRFFGLQPKEASGADKRRLLRERVAPMVEDGERFAEQVLRTYDDNHTVAEFECTVRAAEGRPERWLAHWSRPIRSGLYAGGRIEHYYDITERKRTERHRDRLASIVESAYDAIMRFRLDGTIESWNSAAEEMFGYRAGEMIGRTVGVLAPPGREAESVVNLEKLVRGEKIEQFETVRRCKDGRLIEVSVTSSPIRNGQGEIVGASAVVRDITERNRAYERIRFQAQLLDAVGQAVIATDSGGRITYWNRCAEALYGWAEEEVLGRRVVEVTPADMAEEQAIELMTRLSEGESWSGEFLVRRRDGTSFPVMVSDTPVLGAAGDVVGIIGISWDLSERRRTEEALRTAKEEAERANRSKTDFLSAMSHELRTPLNAIAGYLDLVDLGVHGPVTEAQRAALVRIKRNQEHLLTLINDILHYAKIEAGKTEFRTEVVPVDEMLAGIEPLIEPQAQARGVAYTSQRADSGLSALCDPDRVQQVLLNLASNAIKFTDAAGWVMLSCDADDQWVYIRVSDSGRGISPDQHESVFDPFVQLERHRNETSQQGVGLGLAISRDLAHGMGGDLTVESAPGHGSTFTLVLPRARTT